MKHTVQLIAISVKNEKTGKIHSRIWQFDIPSIDSYLDVFYDEVYNDMPPIFQDISIKIYWDSLPVED